MGLSNFFLFVSWWFFSATAPAEKINWISWQQLEERSKIEPRPIVIDVYTTWCGWCKHMDKTTYLNNDVVGYINQKYYAVKFDAESKEPVTFKGRKFNYYAPWRVHELALYLTNRNLQFPHTVFLSDYSAAPAPLPGYLKPGEIELPLRFFGDSAYLTMNYKDFEKNNKKFTSWK